jgi:hypothetical protein
MASREELLRQRVIVGLHLQAGEDERQLRPTPHASGAVDLGDHP